MLIDEQYVFHDDGWLCGYEVRTFGDENDPIVEVLTLRKDMVLTE